MLELCALLLACSPASVDETHVDELRGFRIDLPEGWKLEEGSGGEAGGFRLTLRPEDVERGVAVFVQIDGDAKGRGAAELCAADRARSLANAHFRDLAELEIELAGRSAPGLEVTYRSGTSEYRIRRSHLVQEGSGWVLQCNAPLEEYDERAPVFGRICGSFAFIELSEEGRFRRRLEELAGRCGSELEWAQDWQEAATRAREESRPVLVVAWLLATFAGASDARHGVLTDADVIALINARFVPLWYERGMEAPFVERYGVSATAFGKSLLALTPQGDPLFETHELDEASVVHEFLRTRLAEHPEYAGPPAPADLEPLGCARRLVARGELDSAWERLDGMDSAAAHLVRARILRLMRRGDEGLGALEAARGAGAGDDPELSLEEARLALCLGRDARAARALEPLLVAEPHSPGFSEALYLRGLLDLGAGRGRSAEQRWRALVDGDPDDRFAWLAAQALRTVDLASAYPRYLGWPPEDAIAEVLAPRVLTPLEPELAAAAADQALAWLLAAQRSDGSWVSPTEVLVGGGGPDPFVDSISALAGRALLGHLDEQQVERAARRALAFARRTIESRRRRPPQTYVMDYTPWSDACLLGLLAEACRAGLAEPSELEPAAELLLADLARRQQGGGGWCYLVTGDPASGRPASHSVSFMTAAVVLALLDAREAGFEVDEDLLGPAVDCLERMRNSQGSFEYRLVHDREDLPRDTPTAGSAGRAPLCELALVRAGRGTPERLRAALELLVEHSALYVAETNKALAHAGPYIIGCHYLMFDYAHAADALGVLEPDPRTNLRLRELVLAGRLADGSFIDNPVVGRSCATALALMALDELCGA